MNKFPFVVLFCFALMMAQGAVAFGDVNARMDAKRHENASQSLQANKELLKTMNEWMIAQLNGTCETFQKHVPKLHQELSRKWLSFSTAIKRQMQHDKLKQIRPRKPGGGFNSFK